MVGRFLRRKPIAQRTGLETARFPEDQKIKAKSPMTTSKPIKNMMPIVPPMNLNIFNLRIYMADRFQTEI
jgi:hypothetical protein